MAIKQLRVYVLFIFIMNLPFRQQMMCKLQAKHSSSASHSQLHHSQPFTTNEQRAWDWHVISNNSYVIMNNKQVHFQSAISCLWWKTLWLFNKSTPNVQSAIHQPNYVWKNGTICSLKQRRMDKNLLSCNLCYNSLFYFTWCTLQYIRRHHKACHDMAFK